MSVLWVGGEDIDFPNGTALSVSTVTTYYRAAYARCAVVPSSNSTLAKSTVFPGGAVTSCWLSLRGAGSSVSTATQWVGLGASGTNKGIFIGSATASGIRLALNKYDGTTRTELAADTSNSLSANVIYRFDLQLVNYGASSTINVYQDGVLRISFSGDSSISGVSGFDSIYMNGTGSSYLYCSEIIVANEDPRSWPGVMTLAPTSAGTTSQWSGTASGATINGTTISDASPVSTDVVSQDEEFNVTDLASGIFVVKAIKISARAAKSGSSTPSKISLGYNNGGTVAVGAAQSLTTAYTTYESLDLTDPTKSAAWLQADINALQIDVRSIT